MTPHHRLARVAAGQLGLFTLAQARAAGLTDHELHGSTHRGRFERIGRAVFAMPGHEPTWERKLLAAVLAVGPTAVVSHASAARLLGFDGITAGTIELTVPRGRRARTQLAVVHTSVALGPVERIRVGRFVVTSGARTVIDLAARLSDDELAAAIGAAARDGWTSETYLRQRLEVHAGRRGAGVVRIALAGPVAHSALERRFLALVRRARLPLPMTQRTYRGERVIRVDAVWEREGVVVEVLGHRFHCTAVDLQRDAQRRNELQAMGLVVLEFTAVDIDRRPAAVAGRLARALAGRRDAFRAVHGKTVTSASRPASTLGS